jgi:hypothetical protein
MSALPPIRVDGPYLFRIACHEGGHAVAAIVEAERLGVDGGDVVLGVKLDKLGLGKLVSFSGRVEENCRALCSLSEPWMRGLKLTSMHVSERRRAMTVADAHLAIILAGPYAELEAANANDKFAYDGNPELRNCHDDFEQVRNLRQNTAQLRVRRRAWLKTHGAAQTVVRKHWEGIQRLAGALLEAGEIDGRRTRELLFAA